MSGQIAFDGSQKGLALYLAGMAPLLFTCGIDYKCGYGLHTGLFGRVRIFVDVELYYLGSAGKELSDLSDDRGHALAVGAPCGKKLYKYYGS